MRYEGDCGVLIRCQLFSPERHSYVFMTSVPSPGIKLPSTPSKTTRMLSRVRSVTASERVLSKPSGSGGVRSSHARSSGSRAQASPVHPAASAMGTIPPTRRRPSDVGSASSCAPERGSGDGWISRFFQDSAFSERPPSGGSVEEPGAVLDDEGGGAEDTQPANKASARTIAAMGHMHAVRLLVMLLTLMECFDRTIRSWRL